MHQPLPITSITLFSTSVAFIKRAGTPASSTTSFLFPTDKINHILKSLSISSKAAIQSITYEGKEQNKHHIRNGDEMSFWMALKGVMVNVTHKGDNDPSRSVQGLVMNLVPTRDGKHLVNKVQIMEHTTGNISWINTANIENLKILDERMESELKDSLKERKVSRIVVSMDSGETPMHMYYSIPLTVWKISYRIILNTESGDKDSTPNSEDNVDKVSGRLLGFAIVDNNLEEDWENISLTLVSGSPVSFDLDLYTPQTRTLPTWTTLMQDATPDDIRRLLALQHSEDSSQSVSSKPVPLTRESKSDMNKKKTAKWAPSIAYSVSSDDDEYGAIRPAPIAKSSTKQESSADMFQYRVPSRVTIRAMESALVPIIDESVSFLRVALYKSTQEGIHPLTALSYHNTTDLTFEAGAVTVSSAEGMLLGESVLQMRKPGEKQFIPFAEDSSLIITQNAGPIVVDYSRNWNIKIESGSASIDVSRVRTTNYTVMNRSQTQRKSLLLQHHISNSLDTECYVGQKKIQRMFSTKEFVTYNISVAAKETLSVTILDIALSRCEYNIVQHLSEDQYKLWMEHKLLADPAVISKLSSLRKLTTEIDELQSQNAHLSPKESNLLSQIQTFRQNLTALQNAPEMKDTRKRYAQEMDSLEKEWKAVMQQKQENSQKIDDLRKQRTSTAMEIKYSNSFSVPPQRGGQ